MTPGRDAFVQLVAVLLASGILRAGCAPRRPPEDALPGRAVDPATLVDSAQTLAAEEERRSRPLEPGERLDPNAAPEAELDRLPGVGPGLARAIVAARDTLPFASVEEVARVRGIGASTLQKLRSGLEVRSVPGRQGRRPTRSVSSGASSRGSLTAAASRAVGPAAGGRVHLNRAGAGELEGVPGIGPVLAGRIVEERERRGGFATVDELVDVKGIGPALLERLRDHLRTGPGG